MNNERTLKDIISSGEQGARSLYSSLFKNSHTIMLLIDPETEDIIDANTKACGFYGYPYQALLSMKISEINTLPKQHVIKELETVKSNKNDHFEFKHRIATGEIKEVEVFCSQIVIDERLLIHSIIHDVTERHTAEREKEELIIKLTAAKAEVKALQGILPICSSCKKIKNENGEWEQVDQYIRSHSGVKFSHGICPECVKKIYPEFSINNSQIDT